MDHDLLLDLRHLDDPSPPSFGALRAEEAARRAAQHQSHRARMLAGAVLAVVLVAGIGVAIRPDARPSGGLESAQATTVPGVPTTPEPTVLPTVAPSPTAPNVPAASTTVPPAAPAPTAPPSAPATTAAATPTVRPPSGAVIPTTAPPLSNAPPPTGTVAPPPDISFTLTLDAPQMAAGGQLRAVIKLSNNRASPVTLFSGGCNPWRADLYRNGTPANGSIVDCAMAHRRDLAAGQAEVVVVQISAGAGLAAGVYDAFSTVTLGENGPRIHSGPRTVTVTRP